MGGTQPREANTGRRRHNLLRMGNTLRSQRNRLTPRWTHGCRTARQARARLQIRSKTLLGQRKARSRTPKNSRLIQSRTHIKHTKVCLCHAVRVFQKLNLVAPSHGNKVWVKSSADVEMGGDGNEPKPSILEQKISQPLSAAGAIKTFKNQSVSVVYIRLISWTDFGSVYSIRHDLFVTEKRKISERILEVVSQALCILQRCSCLTRW